MNQNITDKPLSLEEPFAHAFPFAIAPENRISYASDPVNDTGYTTRAFQGVLIDMTADDTYTLVMSGGDYSVSPWFYLNDTATSIVPDAPWDYVVPFITDIKPKVQESLISSMDFGMVTLDDLNNGDSAINNSLYGGKKYGTLILVDLDPDTPPSPPPATQKYALVIASGELPTDKWYSLGGTAYTPSDPTDIGTKLNDIPTDDRRKELVPKVAAIPFPVVTEVELGDATSNVNAGDGVYNGKDLRAFVVVKPTDETAAPKLYMATGSLPTDKWTELLASDSSVTPA